MSILDSILGALEPHSELNGEQHSSLVQTALQMFGNHAGLSGLINNAQSQGLAQIVQSWVSAGTNQPIDAQRLQALFGQERVNQLANRVGVSPEVANAALTRILPILVDRLTPHGKLPQAPDSPDFTKPIREAVDARQ